MTAPKRWKQSVAMLEMAASGGTTDIVGTPHSDLTYPFQPELIAERVRELNAALGGRIRVHHGCDFHLHFDNIQDCLEIRPSTPSTQALPAGGIRRHADPQDHG